MEVKGMVLSFAYLSMHASQIDGKNNDFLNCYRNHPILKTDFCSKVEKSVN